MNDRLIPQELASSSSGPQLLAVALRSGALRVTPRHRHGRAQLLSAMHGLLSVEAGTQCWVVPAGFAVWIPSGVAHGMRSHGPFSGWSAYVVPEACANMPAQPCVIAVSGLLREAMLRAASRTDAPVDDAQSRLSALILDEIRCSPPVALGLPMPLDARLCKVARALSLQPGDERAMAAWARWAGIAPRTLSRRFVTETGFTFTGWRQRLRLLRSLELLAAGKPVTAIALDLGYENVSAFIALFKREFGVTPGRYMESVP